MLNRAGVFNNLLILPGAPEKNKQTNIQTKKKLQNYSQKKSTKHKHTKRQQGSFLHEHARPLNKRCAWRLTTGFAFIKMARLKAIIAIILLVGLGEFARDLTKCVVCKKKNSNMVLTKAK